MACQLTLLVLFICMYTTSDLLNTLRSLKFGDFMRIFRPLHVWLQVGRCDGCFLYRSIHIFASGKKCLKYPCTLVFCLKYQFCVINVILPSSVPSCHSGDGNYCHFYSVKFSVGMPVATDNSPMNHAVLILQLTVNSQSVDACVN